MNKTDHLERIIKAIEARIAEHDSSDPDELEYVSGLEDALGIVEIELGSHRRGLTASCVALNTNRLEDGMPRRQDDTWWWIRHDPDGPVFKTTSSTRQTAKWEVANWEGGRWYFAGDEYPYDDCEIGEVGPQVINPPELRT